MSRPTTTYARREHTVGNYGLLEISITLTSTTLSQEWLDRSAACVADQAAALMVSHTAGMEGLTPKKEGSTKYRYEMTEVGDFCTSTIEVRLTLNFALVRYDCYQLAAVFGDMLSPHIAEHIEDPGAVTSTENLTKRINLAGFRLQAMLMGVTANEALADEVEHCAMLAEIARSLEPDEPADGVARLLEISEVTPGGGLSVDLSKLGQNEGTGLYL